MQGHETNLALQKKEKEKKTVVSPPLLPFVSRARHAHGSSGTSPNNSDQSS